MVKSATLPMVLMTATAISFPLSKCWLMIWILMEISMTGMTMLLMNGSTKEKAVMFFLFQSFPSITILIVVAMNWISMNEVTSPYLMLTLLSAMICSMGMFPFHSWALKLSKSISWLNNMTMMTIQKIIPLLILMKITLTTLMTLTAAISIAALTLVLLHSSSMKMFMMTSSMAHMSWMVASTWKMKIACLVYLAMYSIIITPIIMQLKKFKYKNLTSQKSRPNSNQMGLKVSLLSLSGLPPLTGFFLKTLVVFFLALYKMPIKLTITFLVAATGAFYAYMQTLTKMLTLKNQVKKEKKMISTTSTKKMIAWNMMMPCIILMK